MNDIKGLVSLRYFMKGASAKTQISLNNLKLNSFLNTQTILLLNITIAC